MADVLPTLREVAAARKRIGRSARRTPLETSPWLSAVAGVPVHLKLECWQRTGSFKVRGAFSAVTAMADDAVAGGLVAASAGNHGQGVALAAAERGVHATVFVPVDAPATKKARIRELGAELREAPDYDRAEEAARERARATGARFVHPASDRDVVAGQGTIGLELLEQLPALSAAVVPVGGGGLIGGIGAVLRSADRAVRVLGVQTDRAKVMRDSLRAGRVLPAPPHEATLADGLAGGIDEAGLRQVEAAADDVVVVPEDSIADAIRGLFEHHGVVAEGAGAAAVAAVLGGVLTLDGPAVLVISGGNIDGRRLAALLDGG